MVGLRLAMNGPHRVHPGQVVRYELELIGDSAAVTTIELTVRTSRGFAFRSEQHQVRADLLVATFRAAGGGHRFPIDIAIPPPPSHAVSRLAWSSLWISVHVDGPDVIEQHFPLHVCDPLDHLGPEPAIARTTQGHVELVLGLGATRATGGTTLVGQCSVTGVPGDLRVTLDVECRITSATGRVHSISIHTSKLHIPEHAAANGVPFTITLPPYLAPSLAIDTHQIEYVVRAIHKRWLTTTAVSIPLHVVDARPAPARIRPPAVGERQVEPVFAEVATRAGWRIGPSVDLHAELGTIMPWIYSAHAGLVMRLGYAFRDDGSTYLISKIRYRPLELGLSVVPNRRGGSLSAADPAWDRMHAAVARDSIRATKILTSVVPELGPLGSIVRWDDHGLICERAVTGVEAALVDEVASALRVVAQKLAHAIGAGALDVGPYR